MLRAVLLSVAVLLPGTAGADEVDDLYEALGLPRIVGVMRAEGIEYGDAMGTDLFASQTPEEWEEAVRLIYDAGWMERRIRANLRQELEGAEVGAMVDFFTEEPGRSIAALEVAGREALLDDAVEEAARDAAAAAQEGDRMALIRDYIAANDLVENNVTGALNANFAFYLGLSQGGAFETPLTEQQILTEVWAQEAEIRVSTTEWLESFLYMAYAPLSDADLDAYVAFSESRAGRDMNASLFAAFDPMFDDVSRALGLAAAMYMAGDTL